MKLESKRVRELEIQREIKIKIRLVEGLSEKGTEWERDRARGGQSKIETFRESESYWVRERNSENRV